MVMPDDDKYSQTRGQLLDQLAYMMGGRAAEELVFHDPTTGAGNDIEKATKVARAMVTDYGMTESLGAVKYGSGDHEPFLGRDYAGGAREYSEDIAAKVDAEVAKLIANAHQEAYDVLSANREVLDELVRQLFEKETLDKEQVAKIFEPLKRWPKRPAWTGSDTRKPSDVPPIDPPERLIPQPVEPAAATAPVPAFPAQPPYPQQLPPGYPPTAFPPASPYPPAGYPGAPGPYQGFPPAGYPQPGYPPMQPGPQQPAPQPPVQQPAPQPPVQPFPPQPGPGQTFDPTRPDSGGQPKKED
jgi:cell division protease FtsH